MAELEKCAEAGDCTRAMLLLDWKMKFESTGTHETSQEHFGKRGLPWHGARIIFFKLVTVVGGRQRRPTWRRSRRRPDYRWPGAQRQATQTCDHADRA